MYHLPWGEQPEHPIHSQQSQVEKSTSQPKQNNNGNINNQTIQTIHKHVCMHECNHNKMHLGSLVGNDHFMSYEVVLVDTRFWSKF